MELLKSLVSVTVLLLFISRIASLYHFYVEVQSLASQRVVGIDGDGFFANFYDANDLGATRGLRLKLHTRFDCIDTFKR